MENKHLIQCICELNWDNNAWGPFSSRNQPYFTEFVKICVRLTGRKRKYGQKGWGIIYLFK